MSPLPSLSDVLLRTQTDERLVRLVVDGDHRAFAMLVQRHRAPLQRVAARLVGPDRSEDIVQQALLRAWVSLAAGTEVRNVQAWLYQILRNAAYTEHARGDHSTSPISEEVADRDSSEAVEHRMVVRELMQRIGDLPEHQRMALVETEFEGRSRQQIATDMGLSEGAVRQLVHRARTALRVAMTAITPYPVLVWMSRHAGGSRLGAGLSKLGEDAAGRSAGLAEPAASGVAAGGALAVKGGVALLAAGAIGGLGLQSLTGHAGHHRRQVTVAPVGMDRHGEADSAAGARTAAEARTAGGAGIGSIALDSARPLTMLTRAVAAPTGADGHVGQARSGSSDSASSDGRSSSRSQGTGQSVSGGDRAAGSGGGVSGSDGGRSSGDGTSQPSSGSTSGGSDGGSFSSPTTTNNASATTSSDGGSGDTSSSGSTTAFRSGSDN